MNNPKTEIKMQFSKLHVIFANVIVTFSFIFSYVLNFILAWYDRQQIEFSVPLAIIGAYAAFATGGYFVQNCIRNTSENKLEAIKCEMSNMLKKDISNDTNDAVG